MSSATRLGLAVVIGAAVAYLDQRLFDAFFPPFAPVAPSALQTVFVLSPAWIALWGVGYLFTQSDMSLFGKLLIVVAMTGGLVQLAFAMG